MKVKEESGKSWLNTQHSKIKIMASGAITSWQIDGETIETETLFSWAPKSLQMVTASHEIKRRLLLRSVVYDQPRQHIKKQRHYFANKGPSSQSHGFSSGRVWM